MKLLLRTLLFLFVFGTSHVAFAMTSTYGDVDGLEINGLIAHDTELFPASSAGIASSFLSSTLVNRGDVYMGAGLPASGLNDMWVFGTKTFSMGLPDIGAGNILGSAILEIAIGGLGLNSPATISLGGQHLGLLTRGDPSGDNTIGSTYNTLFVDTFDITAYITSGDLAITIATGAFDGWALDFARVTFSPLVSSNVSAVPLPAAFWLFGTGLLSLMGLRKKKA